MGDILRIYVWRNPNGNLNVPYLYSNADERNLNLNYFENDWNENYRFLGRRNFLYFSTFLGGFILTT